MATQEIINIGALPNDGSGDPLRVAFSKINNNFANLFATFVNTSNTYSVGNTPGQVIFETPANAFTMGEMYIYTIDSVTDDTQAIQLFAQINSANTDVKFSAYGTTFFGNALSSFNMDVASGNVRILANPLTSSPLLHFIGSQNLWIGQPVPGIELQLDGYVDTVMTTEDDFIITTETP